MPRFATLEESQDWKAQQHVPSPPESRASSSHYRRTLWFHAKKNFYRRDDPSKAAFLCKQLIDRFALTEEAEEAKLLLYDIRLEIRQLVGAPGGKMPVGCRIGIEDRPLQPELAVVEEDLASGSKWPVAVAVVVLPILGIARGDIVGIGLPEMITFAFMQGLVWIGSRLRGLVYTLLST